MFSVKENTLSASLQTGTNREKRLIGKATKLIVFLLYKPASQTSLTQMYFLDWKIEFEEIQSDLIKADHIYVKLDVKTFSRQFKR